MPLIKSSKSLVQDKQLDKVLKFAQVMLSYHSDDSVMHFQYVARYTRLLCMKYNDLYPEKAISKSDIQFICAGAQLHDIGKISVPDNLLRKKGPLNIDEYAKVQQHTIIGAQIIDQLAGIYDLGENARVLHDICLYHHERYDGSGYPQGLAGDKIPLAAQIVSIAEAYDAMTGGNYKTPLTHEDTIQDILSGENKAFSPQLISTLAHIESDFQILLSNKSNEHRIDLLESVYNRNHRSYWIIKRTLDVVFSGTALLLLSPLMLAISAVIFIDDPHGSPIFKQTRLGRHKKPFTMYKFRTMVVNAEARKAELAKLNEKDGPAFKIVNDPRITRAGRFLRKTSLDELPQLLNILKGDMAIVGPRPPLPEEVEQYSRYQEMRLSVTPGLTCIWQVQPKRDAIGFNQWMDMDVGYIGTRSITQDIRIVFMTIASMLGKSGS